MRPPRDVSYLSSGGVYWKQAICGQAGNGDVGRRQDQDDPL